MNGGKEQGQALTLSCRFGELIEDNRSHLTTMLPFGFVIPPVDLWTAENGLKSILNAFADASLS